MRSFSWVIALLLLCACHPLPEVPLNQQLWRLDGPWVSPPGSSARKARATILVFRSGHEFVEFHCWLIEQPDSTLYISSEDPHVMIAGQWVQEKSAIKATRRSIARSQPFKGPRDPLCDQARLDFRISGNSVTGNAGADKPGTYSVVTRLVAPTFESWVKEARSSPVRCSSTPDA
jgi:hypothetical protein